MNAPNHDRGLAYDMQTLLGRRRALVLFGGAGLAAALAACSTSSDSSGSSSATDSECEPIPEETAGPYPGDGSNGPNVLTQSGIVRSDIRSSFGSSSGTADGVPLTIELTVTNSSSSCAPMKGAAVYLWHCDADGNYSMYSPAAADQNYLRGVQETDASGKVTFVSVFPAAYMGRWPHIHFEVYASLDDATSAGDPVTTAPSTNSPPSPATPPRGTPRRSHSPSESVSDPRGERECSLIDFTNAPRVGRRTGDVFPGLSEAASSRPGWRTDTSHKWRKAATDAGTGDARHDDGSGHRRRTRAGQQRAGPAQCAGHRPSHPA